jgi:predicted NBD/HSP70 family sugar kinase
MARRPHSRNIDRIALLEELAREPKRPQDLAGKLGVNTDSVRRRLRSLSTGRLVRASVVEPGTWELGSRTGQVLVGAVGSSRINACLFDPYTRALCAKATRRSAAPASDSGSDLHAIIAATAATMAAVLRRAAAVGPVNVSAIGLALPFGLDPHDATLLTGETGENAKSLLSEALAHHDVGVDFASLPWVWASDVACEGVFEYHFGPEPQKDASPLLIVKVSRDVRSSLIIDGRPVSGLVGDVADLDGLLTWTEDGGTSSVPIALGEAVAPTALYQQMTDGGELSASKWREAEEHVDADIFDSLFQPLLRSPGDAGVRAREVMHRAGELIGRCLDGPITACGPRTVVITGFLARDDAQLKDGLLRACRRHRLAGVGIELGSGIEAEVRRGVKDSASLEPPAERPVLPHELPHQYRVAGGAAKIAVEQFLLPAVRASAEARDNATGP